MTWQEILDSDALVAVVGTPIPRVAHKVRPALTALDRAWLADSPFCLIAPSDEAGRCDVSPKGDPAGQLAYVLDERTIAIAERPGNRRVDGYRNVVVNPQVGPDFKGQRPILAVVVEIEEDLRPLPESLSACSALGPAELAGEGHFAAERPEAGPVLAQ